MVQNINYLHKCYLHNNEVLLTVDETNNTVVLSEDKTQIISFNFINNYKIKLENVVFPSKFIAMIDAIFSYFTDVNIIELNDVDNGVNQLTLFLKEIWILGSEIHRDLFYQNRSLCLSNQNNNYYPQKYLLDNHSYCPKRPINDNGELYRRYIPWLQQTLSFRLFDMDKDLDIFHQWMNDPDIDFFWEESGTISKHKEYIQARLTHDIGCLPLISCLDGKPFGYFETYWAKEDRLSTYYQAEDFDRGWHVLIGDKNYRGKSYVTAWMPSISHYLFLDDIRTQRIVIEPRIDNKKMIKSLNKCGYAHTKTFDFPHKRAMLGMLNREHFFSSSVMTPQ